MEHLKNCLTRVGSSLTQMWWRFLTKLHGFTRRPDIIMPFYLMPIRCLSFCQTPFNQRDWHQIAILFHFNLMYVILLNVVIPFLWNVILLNVNLLYVILLNVAVTFNKTWSFLHECLPSQFPFFTKSFWRMLWRLITKWTIRMSFRIISICFMSSVECCDTF